MGTTQLKVLLLFAQNGSQDAGVVQISLDPDLSDDLATELEAVASEGGGVFEAIFGWIIDVITSILGSSEDLAEDAPKYVPEDPVPMTNDTIFIEYIPTVEIAEEATVEETDEPEAETLILL